MKSDCLEDRLHTIFVRNVHFAADVAELQGAVSQRVGGVVDVVLFHQTGASSHRGYGFVRFQNENYVRAALAAQYIFVRGRRAFFEAVRHPAERAPQMSSTRW